MADIKKNFNDAIWIAKKLFDKDKATGSSANLSFKVKNKIYITGSNTCFGNLKESDFSIVDINGNVLNDVKPSKEAPLHISLYKKDNQYKSVIHTHSFYSTLWSCLNHSNHHDVVPEYTPYLKMRIGSIGLVPYEKPGSEELFKVFEENKEKSNGFLLENHGPIVPGADLLSTFYIIEELEESCKIAWYLKDESQKKLI